MAEKLGPYEIDRVHCVEALEALRTLPAHSVDALITDPPYSSGGFSRSDRAASPKAKYISDCKRDYPDFEGDSRDGRSWLLWCSLWLAACKRAVKPGGYALMFTDWRQLANACDAFQAGGFLLRGIMAWDKGTDARPPHTGYARQQAEFIVWGSAGALPPAPGRGPFPGVHRARPDARQKLHLTGKPLELMQGLVRMAPPGGIVLDPFAGSGSTIAACIREGRRGLGFELSAEYLEIANVRLTLERAGFGANRASVLEAMKQGQRQLNL